MLRENAKTAEREHGRKLIVKLIFVAFWIVMIEGALRKWLFPSMNKFIFFINDPVVLTIYALAIRYRLLPIPSPFIWTGLALMLGFVLLLVVQLVVGHLNPLVLFYGYRLYFFLIPLAFIIGYVFNSKDLKLFIKQTLIFAIPIAGLVFMQWHSPVESFINRDTTGGEVEIMQLLTGIVRPAATFATSMVMPMYICFIVGMIVSLWIVPSKQRPVSLGILIPATVSCLLMIAFTGERATYFYVAFCLIFATIATFLMRSANSRIKSMIMLGVLGLCAVVLMGTVFRSGISAMIIRKEGAEASEGSIWKRAWSNIRRSEAAFTNRLTWYGNGMGLGSGGGSILARGKRSMPMGETEWVRVINETSIAGMLYIVWRTVIAGWLFWQAVLAVRRTGNPWPLTLCAVTVPMLIVGQITMVGVLNSFCWFMVGINIAANNLGLVPVYELEQQEES